MNQLTVKKSSEESTYILELKINGNVKKTIRTQTPKNDKSPFFIENSIGDIFLLGRDSDSLTIAQIGNKNIGLNIENIRLPDYYGDRGSPWLGFGTSVWWTASQNSLKQVNKWSNGDITLIFQQGWGYNSNFGKYNTGSINDGYYVNGEYRISREGLLIGERFWRSRSFRNQDSNLWSNRVPTRITSDFDISFSNAEPLGPFTVEGTFDVGEQVKAARESIVDSDIVTETESYLQYRNTQINYEWEILDNDQWNRITDTEATDGDEFYTPKIQHAGKKIRSIATYTDGGNTRESVTSNEYIINGTHTKPTDISISISSFNENTSQRWAILSTLDADYGDTFSYSFVDGVGANDNALFTIGGNSIWINTSPDHETQDSYSIRLQVTDSGDLTFQKSFTLNVNDINEDPTNLSLSASTFNENITGGSAVATLRTIDPDSGDTFTYSLVSGTGDTENNAFTILGDQLKIKSSPDYETKESYSVRVQTEDSGGLTFEKTFTITVNNIKEVLRSSTNKTLPTSIENLVLTGTGNLKGYGNSSNNRLTGNSGNNLLDGKAGIDLMIGEGGNDTYIVDERKDRVVEKAGGGTDTIRSSVNENLTANVENLVLTGTENLKGYGNSSNNRLTGNSGNNLLDGKAGIDVMIGKGGNDTYIVDERKDRVVEKAGGGTDTIRSSVNENLTANVENLVLTGTGNLKGYGNSGNNRLTGNSGSNVLEGKAGRDILTGKDGGDKFVYRSTNDSGITKSTRDIITDFDSTEYDRIDLSKIDAYTEADGNQKFVYIGSDSFSGTQGEVRFASGILGLNTGTDTTADMQIKLNGVSEFSADFLIL